MCRKITYLTRAGKCGWSELAAATSGTSPGALPHPYREASAIPPIPEAHCLRKWRRVVSCNSSNRARWIRSIIVPRSLLGEKCVEVQDRSGDGRERRYPYRVRHRPYGPRRSLHTVASVLALLFVRGARRHAGSVVREVGIHGIAKKPGALPVPGGRRVVQLPQPGERCRTRIRGHRTPVADLQLFVERGVGAR